MSVVFLFGAGASAFSGDCFPKNPPLGAGLFQELLRQGGVAETVGADHRELFERNFEDGMATFWALSKVDRTGFLRDVARYFAQFFPGEKNAYISVLRAILAAPRPAV